MAVFCRFVRCDHPEGLLAVYTSVSGEPNTITLPILEQASCGWCSHQNLTSFSNDPVAETFLLALQEGTPQRL